MFVVVHHDSLGIGRAGEVTRKGVEGKIGGGDGLNGNGGTWRIDSAPHDRAFSDYGSGESEKAFRRRRGVGGRAHGESSCGGSLDIDSAGEVEVIVAVGIRGAGCTAGFISRASIDRGGGFLVKTVPVLIP